MSFKEKEPVRVKVRYSSLNSVDVQESDYELEPSKPLRHHLDRLSEIFKFGKERIADHCLLYNTLYLTDVLLSSINIPNEQVLELRLHPRHEVDQALQSLEVKEKRSIFCVKNRLKDPLFALEFQKKGGIKAFSALIDSTNGNTLAYAMAAVETFLSHQNQLVETLPQNFLKRIVALMEDQNLNVRKSAFEILIHLLNEHRFHGYHRINDLLENAVGKTGKSYKIIAKSIESNDVGIAMSALKLINALLSLAPSENYVFSSTSPSTQTLSPQTLPVSAAPPSPSSPRALPQLPQSNNSLPHGAQRPGAVATPFSYSKANTTANPNPQTNPSTSRRVEAPPPRAPSPRGAALPPQSTSFTSFDNLVSRVEVTHKMDLLKKMEANGVHEALKKQCEIENKDFRKQVYRYQRHKFDTLLQQSEVVFDTEKPDHANLLLQFWSYTFPDDRDISLITSKWRNIGFQGTNPMTDFRGMGILGLKLLIYFVKNNAEAFRTITINRMYKEGLDAKFYPVAVAGLNIADMLFDLFRVKKEVLNEDGYGEVYTILFDHPSAFEELFMICFEAMDKIWEKKDGNYLLFPQVLSVAKQLTYSVLFGPGSSSLRSIPSMRVKMFQEMENPSGVVATTPIGMGVGMGGMGMGGGQPITLDLPGKGKVPKLTKSKSSESIMEKATAGVSESDIFRKLLSPRGGGGSAIGGGGGSSLSSSSGGGGGGGGGGDEKKKHTIPRNFPKKAFKLNFNENGK